MDLPATLPPAIAFAQCSLRIRCLITGWNGVGHVAGREHPSLERRVPVDQDAVLE